MEGNSQFDRNAEERSMAYFSFSVKVFHWCRIFLIPVAVLYLAMMIYGHRMGVSSAGGVLFLLCIVVYLVILSKQERAYTQYAREARAVIEQNSTEPYSRKAMELRDALQKTGKSVYYLIAGMILFLGLLCLAGGSGDHVDGRQPALLGFSDPSSGDPVLSAGNLLYPDGQIHPQVLQMKRRSTK